MTFAANDQVTFAVKYALMIISEAATELGDTAPGLQPGLPWREIRSLGNRLRHDYDTVDLARIWLLIERDLPPLKAACQARSTAVNSSRHYPHCCTCELDLDRHRWWCRNSNLRRRRHKSICSTG